MSKDARYFGGEQLSTAMAELDAHANGARVWPIQLLGFSVRFPEAVGLEYLATVRGVDAEGVRVVAFHSAMELQGLLRGIVARAKNGTLSWRTDEFAR